MTGTSPAAEPVPEVQTAVAHTPCAMKKIDWAKREGVVWPAMVSEAMTSHGRFDRVAELHVWYVP